MRWFYNRAPRNRVVCFIDDDSTELVRFERAMKSHFTCITATTYEMCRTKLKRAKLKPDLWVLDLFFPSPGHTNSQHQLEEMTAKYAEIEQKVREFRAFLASIGQGTNGGVDLLKRCLHDFRAPVVMFTRKGTLDDAIRCFDLGATNVLKKPMPHELSGSYAEKIVQLDEAMMASADYLSDHLWSAMRTNGFWYKHKSIILFVLGAAISAASNKIAAHFLN